MVALSYIGQPWKGLPMQNRTALAVACAAILILGTACGTDTPRSRVDTVSSSTTEVGYLGEPDATDTTRAPTSTSTSTSTSTTATTVAPTVPVTAPPTLSPTLPPTTAPPTTAPPPSAPPAITTSPPTTGRCGGDLPPCYVMERESGGDPRVWNGGCYAPVGHVGISPCGVSDASGKWQFLRSSWAGYGGYLNAADAPEWVQDEKARMLFAGGAGCSHWGCG